MKGSIETRVKAVIARYFNLPPSKVNLVKTDGETVWLTQEQMCQLFGRERSVITKHIRNVFKDGEQEENSVCAKFAHTAADGKVYQVSSEGTVPRESVNGLKRHRPKRYYHF